MKKVLLGIGIILLTSLNAHADMTCTGEYWGLEFTSSVAGYSSVQQTLSSGEVSEADIFLFDTYEDASTFTATVTLDGQRVDVLTCFSSKEEGLIIYKGSIVIGDREIPVECIK